MIQFFKFFSLFTILLFGFSAQAQYRSQYNYIGIQGGVSSFNILTDNFNTTPQTGFTGGFSVRGGIVNSFDMVYGIDFYQQKFGLGVNRTTPVSGIFPIDTDEIDMSMLAVQVKVLGSLVLIHKHLSLELGPTLQVNSDLRYDDKYKNATTQSNYVIVDDIEVNKINFNLIAGITGGFEHFRLYARYQYGINNFLKPPSSEDLDYGNTEFKGNISMLEAGLTIYF